MSEDLIRRSDAIKAINSVGWLEDAEYEERILAIPTIEPKRGWDAERMLTAPVTHGNQYTFYKAEREAKECHAT